jgi:hypothetical protein
VNEIFVDNGIRRRGRVLVSAAEHRLFRGGLSGFQ